MPNDLVNLIKKDFNEINKYVLEIGVFVDDTGRKEKVKIGVTNAELMFIHENGSPLQHIPSRPVLQMTIDYANKEILPKTLDKIIDLILKGQKDKIEPELQKLALRMERYARDIIYSNDGRLVPNAPSTIAKKGDNHPLFDTGQLARSITCRVVKLN